MRVLLSCFALLLCMQGFSQSLQLDNVLKVKMRNFGPIIENNQVKGYYGFYKAGNARGRDVVYLLKILDENAKEVVSKRMIRPYSYYLTEAVYNGNAIVFSFIDNAQRTIELVSYNMAGEQIGTRKYPKMDGGDFRLTYAYQNIDNEESSNLTIFPAGDQGFVRMSFEKDRKIRYKLEYLPNTLSATGRWVKGSEDDSDEYEIPEVADVVAPFMISGIAKRKNAFDKDIHYNLQVRDMFTGEPLFDKPLSDPRYILSFLMAKFDPVRSHIIVLGEYFDPRDNIFNGKSLGLYVKTVSMSGEVLSSKLLSWESDISRFLPANAKGRLEEGGFIAFHHAALDNDGNVVFVGERYRKAVSGIGVALQLAGSNDVSTVKMVVEEMMIFSVNAKQELTGVDVFEKKAQSILLPGGWGLYSSKTLSQMMAAYGLFDYQYSQQSLAKDLFLSTYMSVEKEKGEPRHNILGVIAKAGSDGFTTDKIDLSSEADAIGVYPGKTGSVLIVEYYRKEKQLRFRLEDFNY
ncbi:MAG: hypothetical protein NWR72_15795 [Bacteroidia bacterium]|nr:hypothetical protein [Bacteroidia bacterium]